MMMDSLHTSEMLVFSIEIIRRYIPDDSHLQLSSYLLYENLPSNISILRCFLSFSKEMHDLYLEIGHDEIIKPVEVQWLIIILC
jgi:hypothetical protein